MNWHPTLFTPISLNAIKVLKAKGRTGAAALNDKEPTILQMRLQLAI